MDTTSREKRRKQTTTTATTSEPPTNRLSTRKSPNGASGSMRSSVFFAITNTDHVDSVDIRLPSKGHYQKSIVGFASLMPSPQHDPPEINPFESPKSEPPPKPLPHPEFPLPRESPWTLVKLMSPVWFPGIFYVLCRWFGLPEEISFSGNTPDGFFTLYISSVPLVLATAAAVIGLCVWCTTRWLRDRNARVAGACAIFFGICSIPAAILITAVFLQAYA